MIETHSGWEDLYDPVTQTMRLARVGPGKPVSAAAARESTELSMNFITPLRIQSNAHRIAVADISFYRLCKDVLRRVRLLAAAAGDDNSTCLLEAWSDRTWLEQVRDTSLEPELRWFDWERTSSRQCRAIRVGGWLGKIKIRNASEIGIAVLNMGEVVGLGKECVFGFGQFELSAFANSLDEAVAPALK